MAETTMEAVPIPTEEPKREKKKRKFSFPRRSRFCLS